MKQIISGRKISMKVIYSILLIAITACTTSSDNGCEKYMKYKSSRNSSREGLFFRPSFCFKPYLMNYNRNCTNRFIQVAHY